MATTRKFVKVFLASPSDLGDERRAAKAVADEVNSLLAEEFGYQIELVGWEDTVSVYGRPQATINRELQQCELFVGMLWRHWGTPPDMTGPYSSGFEEEFRTSVLRRKATKQPEMSLFFKSVPAEQVKDPGVHLKKVLDFKDEIMLGKEVLFETFADLAEFEKRLRRCLITYIKRLRAQHREELSELTQSPAVTAEDKEVAVKPKRTNPLSEQGANYLRSFVSDAENVAEGASLDASHIARFRLLSLILETDENDKKSMGVHDANLIFADRAKFDLGRPELFGLVEGGLDHYAEQVTPLWYWVERLDGLEHGILSIYSRFGGRERRQKNVLVAMRLIGELIPNNREEVLQAWFRKSAPSTVKNSALEYLADYGVPQDLFEIRKELSKNDNQTSNAAAESMIRIALRESHAQGIEMLFDLNPARISDGLAASIFDDNRAHDFAVLARGLVSASGVVRRHTVNLLIRRGELTQTAAQTLLADPEPEIRYLAVEALEAGGQSISEVDARKIIVRRSARRNNLGFLGSFGSLGSLGEMEGEEWLQKRVRARLSKMDIGQLEKLVDDDVFINTDPYAALAVRRFDHTAARLRAALDDGYKSEFDKYIARQSELIPGREDLLAKTRDLEQFLRSKLTSRTLQIICEQYEPGDLQRVRAALARGDVEFVDEAVNYLGECGEWEDIPRLIAALEVQVGGQRFSFLDESNASRVSNVSRSIHRLAGKRLAHVFALKMPPRLLESLLLRTSFRAFSKMSRSKIIELLHSPDDEVRKIVALMSIASLTRGTLAKVLDGYRGSEGSQFYNVIHWFDFGLSCPSTICVPAAKRALQQYRDNSTL